jgi:hypothetical protein
MHHQFTQAEGVANVDQVPEAGALIAIGYAKPQGGAGGYARYVAIAPKDWPYGVSVSEAPGAPLPKQPYPLKRNAEGVLVPTAPREFCRVPIPGGRRCQITGRLLRTTSRRRFMPIGPAAAQFVLACDHAGNAIPRRLGSLGLDQDTLQRHVAWDIGAVGVARHLSALLDAPLVSQPYSRLVVDCNRGRKLPTSFR